MFDRLTIEQSVRASWCRARLHVAAAALWSAKRSSVALGLLYGVVAYFSCAILIGVPGQALLALIVVGPMGWWCFGRYQVMTSAQMSKLGFFTGENGGPLRLSEDIMSPKIVYCIGLRNEGKKAVTGVRVTVDVIDGQPPETPASLPVFRNPTDNAELQPGESEYFCVMRIVDGAGQDGGTAVLCCPDDQGAPRCGLRELQDGATITLSACGEGAPRLTGRIRISSRRETEAPWSLDLQLLPDAEEAPAPAHEQSREAPSPAPAAPVQPKPGVEEAAVTAPVVPHAATTAMPAVEHASVLPPPIREQPPVDVPPAHSDRIRRMLARQART